VICADSSCDRRAAAKGFCIKHYHRWRRHGDSSIARPMCGRGTSIEDRLALVTDRSGGPDSCWPFTRAPSTSGYGYLQVDGVVKGVHVWAWESANGPLDEGLIVRHSCDNPPCANPAHLISGTGVQNMADKVERNRQYRPAGSNNARARLTADDVRSIRSGRGAGQSTAELAAKHGVSKSAVQLILAGKRWAHIEDGVKA
jgi:hypothetical protein